MITSKQLAELETLLKRYNGTDSEYGVMLAGTALSAKMLLLAPDIVDSLKALFEIKQYRPDFFDVRFGELDKEFI